MIDTTFDQAKKIITKDLDNWNSNFWRLRCREQVIAHFKNVKYLNIHYELDDFV